MAFHILGSPGGEITESQIKFFIQYHLQDFIESTSHRVYTEKTFFSDLECFAYRTIDESKVLGDQILLKKQAKNKFIEWELKSLNSLINWFKECFEYYGLSAYDISGYSRPLRRTQYTIFPNLEGLTEMKRAAVIIDTVEGMGPNEFIEYLATVYTDLIKIRAFLENEFDHTTSKTDSTTKPEQDKDLELSLPQIALLFHYEGGGISRDNCDATAEEYGWKAKTSGHKLYQYFNKFRENSERIGDPGSKVKLKNKINLLESVLLHLTNPAAQKAKEEIDHLKKLFEAQYE